jgi:hypothetical protein
MVFVGQIGFKHCNIFEGDRTKLKDSLPDDEAHTVTNINNFGTLSETTFQKCVLSGKKEKKTF